MPQIPVVSDAVQRVRELTDTLLVQGRTTVTEVVDNVRTRVDALPALPGSVIDELRRHLSMSDLATKDAVEVREPDGRSAHGAVDGELRRRTAST